MESIWWPEEQWWEKKVVPLGFVSLSLRQLATLMGGVVVGLVVSEAFSFPLAGASFGGRAVSFFFIVAISYVVAIRRVRMLPVELQSYYVLRKNGGDRLRARLSRLPLLRRVVKVRVAPPVKLVQEMVVEDFKDPMPLVLTSRVKGLGEAALVALYLDDDRRAEEAVTPEKPGYRLVYLPRPEDVGVHRLTARLEATGEVLISTELTLKARTADLARSVFARRT